MSGLVTRFLVKNTGAVTGPFTTTFSPATLKCLISPSGMSGYGALNFTKDYLRMVVMSGAQACNGTNGGGANDNGMVYIYNTNTTTGALTLQASWVSSGWIGSAGGAHGGYTADFSPLENYVYVGQVYPGMLTRYDIQTPTSAAIKASEWPISFDTLDTNTAHIRESGAHIRRGPDGRMWIADRAVSYYPKTFEGAAASTPCKMSYISAPDSPTQTGVGIGLKLDAITLPAGSCSIWGLPQMATVFKPRIVLY
ncbi:hypothetical protein H7Y29_02685 [Microbacteriaceae bacterium]|nr:hypothetical protein [Candidatus Saccharibacteria bacterium]